MTTFKVVAGDWRGDGALVQGGLKMPKGLSRENVSASAVSNCTLKWRDRRKALLEIALSDGRQAWLECANRDIQAFLALKDAKTEVTPDEPSVGNYAAPIAGLVAAIFLAWIIFGDVKTFRDFTQSLKDLRIDIGVEPVPPTTLDNTRRWVAPERLNLRSCPSSDCGVVGRLNRGAVVKLHETRGEWARISAYYDAQCVEGASLAVISGDWRCVGANGVFSGRLADWVSMRHLSSSDPTR